MIVSHGRRFIFIKTSKTAGTSVEMQLSKFCGPDDIVTPGMESKDPKYAQYADSRRPRNLAMPLHRAAYVSLPIPPLIFAKKHIRPRRTFYDHCRPSAFGARCQASSGETISNLRLFEIHTIARSANTSGIIEMMLRRLRTPSMTTY